MHILITGASGFLGSHVTKALRAAGHEVFAPASKDVDLRKSDSLAKFAAVKLDRIYHLAAWTQAGDFCLHHAGEQWIINQQINTNVLQWWKEHQPQAKLIAIGSSCCYEPGTPHREENFLSGTPIESLYTYAMTKRMLYTGLLSLHKQFGLEYLFLVPSTLYGPDYHLDGRQMHFIFDLMRKIVDGAQKGASVVLWGDGSQCRELIHVSDFVRAMLALSDSHENDIVNIGGGSEHSIRSFAEILSRIIGFDPQKIEYDTSKYVGAKSKVLDIGKLRRLLPHFVHTELELGLTETVQWYRTSIDSPESSSRSEAERYLELAKEAIENGKENEARTLLRKAAALEPNSPRLKALRAKVRLPETVSTTGERNLKATAASIVGPPIFIDQFVSAYTFGDEIGNCIGLLARIFRDWGFTSNIFAETADERLRGDWHLFQQHETVRNPRNIIFYHPSDGRSAILPYLVSAEERKILYFHNITPPAFFEPWDPESAESCRSAIEAVGAIKPFMKGALADSEFNARDLQALGYESPRVISLPFFRSEFMGIEPSNDVLEAYRDDRTNILFVGNFVPNKCQHELIKAFAAYQRSFNAKSRLILAGSTVGSGAYTRHLEQLVDETGAKEVIFTGNISRAELVGYYRVADIFLCLSEHEGFCSPLLEAMHFEIPIVAFDGTAVSETLASCARMVKTKEEMRIAAQLDSVQKEKALRNVIVSRQLARLEAFSEERFRDKLANFIEPLLLE